MSQVEDRETETVRVFSEVARRLQQADSAEETWQQIADLASEIHPAFAHTGVSVVHRDGTIDTPAASDDVSRTADRIQYEENEGPCLSAIRYENELLTGDLASEQRWPRFASRVVDETGVRSMLCFKLFAEDETLGALNFYSESVDAFDERAEVIGDALSTHAAIAMESAIEHQDLENLESALDTSRTIGAAIGMLMVQSAVNRNRAFQMLSAASQRMNVKLNVLAERIVLAHEANVEADT